MFILCVHVMVSGIGLGWLENFFYEDSLGIERAIEDFTVRIQAALQLKVFQLPSLLTLTKIVRRGVSKAKIDCSSHSSPWLSEAMVSTGL